MTGPAGRRRGSIGHNNHRTIRVQRAGGCPEQVQPPATSRVRQREDHSGTSAQTPANRHESPRGLGDLAAVGIAANQNSRPCCGGCRSTACSRFTRERSQVRNPPRPSSGSPASAEISSFSGATSRTGPEGSSGPLVPTASISAMICSADSRYTGRRRLRLELRTFSACASDGRAGR